MCVLDLNSNFKIDNVLFFFPFFRANNIFSINEISTGTTSYKNKIGKLYASLKKVIYPVILTHYLSQ